MKERVVLCGGGPHSHVVADLLLDGGEWDIAGVVDKQGEVPFGLPLLGMDDDLPALFVSGIHAAFVAVGDNQVRLRLIARLSEIGFRLINVIAPDAVVSSRATLGRGVLVNHGAIVNAGAVIGDGVILNTACSVDHDCRVGPCAHIAPGAHVSGSTRIGACAFLGVGCCVKDCVTIGDRVMIGAGAAVVRDLPSDVVAVGVPARVIKHTGK